jgi:PadR family transcriptional regulator
MKHDPISSQEEIVLLAVGSLQPEAYAYAAIKEIKDHSNQNWSLGTVHTILYRLENKGLLKSEMGGSSSKRGGRSKRLYMLSANGYDVVEEIMRMRQTMWTKVATNRVSFHS